MSGQVGQALLGRQDAASNTTDTHAQEFTVDARVAQVSTATLVQIHKNTNTPGQVAPIGRVDVVPLVNQIDGWGNPTPHVVLHNLPYTRWGAGTNAILMEPEANDLGLVVFADRDISSVLAKSPAGNAGNAQANPGSRRRHDMQDGVYVGLARGPAPVQYVAFTATGITIKDKNNNLMVFGPDGVNINGALINHDGDVITKHGTSLDMHVNTGVTPGGADTGPPP